MTPSPESRLLDLIRKKSSPHWKKRWRGWFGATSTILNDRFNLDSVDPWRWGNACLALLLLGTLGYGGFLLLRQEPLISHEMPGHSQSRSDHNSASRKSTLSDLTRRDLFKDMAPPPPPPPAVEVPAGPPPPPKIPLSERASRFRLVGILPGEKPQAIIEDTQTQRMIYATQGQYIEGILVESVTAGKVVLSDGDDRFDITL